MCFRVISWSDGYGAAVLEPVPAAHRVVNDVYGRPVLVKRCTDEAGRARLAREHAVLRAVAGPGVVGVVDLVDSEAATELHLAWVGPHSLATIAGAAPEGAGHLVAAVADAVLDLHCAGYAHGRLSADHVLLGEGWRPVLTGLADAATIEPARAADDVAGLGGLLTDLLRGVDEPLVVDGRGARARGSGLRAALLTLADHAQAPDPEVRPTVDALAASIRAALPRSVRRVEAGAGHGAPGVPDAERGVRRVVALASAGAARLSARGPRRAPDPTSAARVPSGAVPSAGGAGGAAVAADGPGVPRGPDRSRVPEGRSRVPDRSRVQVTPVRIGLAIGLGLAVAGTVTAATWLRPDAAGSGAAPAATDSTPFGSASSADGVGPTSSEPTSASAPSTTVEPGGPTVLPPPSPPAVPAPSAPADAAGPTEGSGPSGAGCPPGAGADSPSGPDVDGDGCPDVVTVEGERVTFGGTTWVVGRTGDRVVVADWDCDGTATAAALRPSSGEVFVFDRWVVPGDEITVNAAATVAGASELEVVDPDADGCSDLVVVRDGGGRVRVEVGP